MSLLVPNNPEYASQEQIASIYDSTSAWLFENGSLDLYQDKDREVLGVFNALPVVKDYAPLCYFDISWEALELAAADVIEQFELKEGPLCVGYSLPCYSVEAEDQDQGVDPDLEDPEVIFYFDKHKTSRLYSERIGIVRSSVFGGLCRVNRMQEMVSERPAGVKNIDVRGLDPGDQGSITAEECRALGSLVSILCLSDPEKIRYEPHWVDKIRLQ